MFVKLHPLVQATQKAIAAKDHKAAKAKWREVDEEINMLSDYESGDLERFCNVLYDRVNDPHTGSSDIDLDQLMEHVRKHPEAGKRRYTIDGPLF